MPFNAPPHILAIPIEIWVEIFEYFAPSAWQGPFPTGVHSDTVREGLVWKTPGRRSLHNLSQVCSLFYDLATRVSLRFIVVTQRLGPQFWAQRVARAGKGNLTKRLEIINVDSGLLPLLLELANVQDIYLHYPVSNRTRTSRTTDLAQPTYQHLTNLTLYGLSVLEIADLLPRLSTAASALQRLWLPVAIDHERPLIAPIIRYTLPQLQWLIVGTPVRRYQLRVERDALLVLLRLFGNMLDLPSLRRFDCFGRVGYPDSFLAKFGEELEVIALTSDDDDAFAWGVEFPAHCPRLKSVIVVLITQDRMSDTLTFPTSVKRLVLLIPPARTRRHNERELRGLKLLRRVLYNVSRRRFSTLNSIIIYAGVSKPKGLSAASTMSPDVPTYKIARRGFKLVLAYCTLRELKIFSDLPVTGEMARMELMERVWSLLKDSGLAPERTIERMREGNVVVTGPHVLNVLLPDCHIDDRLCFCCPTWGKEAFLEFLQHSTYRVLSADNQVARDEFYGLQSAHTGCRHATFLANEDGHSITLLESVSMSPLVPVFFSPTTAGMNYISADGVACLYPGMTLSKTCLTNYARHLSDDDRRVLLDMYATHGFEVIGSCEAWHSHGMTEDKYTAPESAGYCQRKTKRIDRPDALMLPFAKRGFVPIRPFTRWRLGHNVQRPEDGSWEEKDVVASVEAEGGSFIEYDADQPIFRLNPLLHAGIATAMIMHH
ncbi:hypothetical protein DFP72DRAFT_1073323 [Ephemerocybe angulata]|uniref:Uncharacterized protein n=1 Tax=Ephemerocybe angulata TaxID=980116 RepID=A0A8H6HP15_9AGAR|nr:hypothetical protein DFP72DRAFT_1073323 [Tulosesus angulatus]